MKRTVLILSVATTMVALGGCGVTRLVPKGDPASAPMAVAEPGAPKPTAGQDWRLVTDADHALLAYGSGSGADDKLMLTCAKGSGQVSVWRPNAEGAASGSVTVRSGTAQGTFLAVAQPSPVGGGGQTLAFNASTLDPIMQAFWKRGWLDLVDGDTVTHMSPQPGNNVVRSFFSFCAG
jgi:hypothetical protein